MTTSTPESGQTSETTDTVANITFNDAGNEGQGQTQEPPADNPAWAEYLQEIPDAFQPKIKEAFKRWDQGVNAKFQEKAQEYQSQLQRYQQFDPLIQSGLGPDHIRAAQAIINELQTNPQGLYERLGQHLGITPEQAREAVEGELNEDEDENVDPRYEQLVQRQQQMEEFLHQQHVQQMQEQADKAVEREYNDVKTKYNLNDKEMQEVMITAAHLVSRDPRTTLDQAFQNWDQRRRELYAQSPNANAPSVVPVNGGDPTAPSKSYADMTPEEWNADLLNALTTLNKTT